MRFGSLLFPFSLLFAQEITVDLNHPTYRNGILYTDEGGVVESADIRIQAKSIQYTNKDQIHKIEAEGDLLIQTKNEAFVGSEIEYDFLSKTGTLYNGVTASSLFFAKAEMFHIMPKGNYRADEVSLTTCENKESTWDLHAQKLEVTDQEFFEAKQIRFRVFQVPLFWLPSFKLNLKRFKEPIFHYSLDWDKGQGPRGAIRYQLYSWHDFALYGRVEYRWKTGWGGAIETDYFPPEGRTRLLTKSYLGTDRLQTAPNKERRYRVQGALQSVSESQKTHLVLTWDKYNDVRMPSLFKPDDFEVQTAKKTLLFLSHREDPFLVSLKTRPKLNPFESIKQDLPSLFFRLTPREIGNTGIYNFFSAKGSYLDFSYSSQLVQTLSNFHSLRFEIREKMIRPFQWGPITLTPAGAFHSIFYGNSPSRSSQWQNFFTYGLDLSLKGQKKVAGYQNLLEPYLSFFAITKPSVQPDQHYIFSIADGYQKLYQLKGGISSSFFQQSRPIFQANLFANAFFSDATIPQVIPRLYLDLSWRLPSVSLFWENCWNFRNHLLDTSKARLLWTISENSALTLEGRYRSEYDWRKADHENFILDVTRSQSELLLSPLSDRRITFLASAFVRFNPLWEGKLSFISGFYRLHSSPYTEVKADLSTWLSTSFRLRLSYSHIRYDDRVSFHIDLVKPPRN